MKKMKTYPQIIEDKEVIDALRFNAIAGVINTVLICAAIIAFIPQVWPVFPVALVSILIMLLPLTNFLSLLLYQRNRNLNIVFLRFCILDPLILTIILHYSGDMKSSVAFIYLIPIIMGALIFSLKKLTILATIYTGFYLCLVFLEGRGIIPPVHTPGLNIVSGYFWIFSSIALILLVAAGIIIVEAIARKRERADRKIAAELKTYISEMQDNLIRDVSHSLRTPIAMAQMALNICENGLKTRDIKQIEQAKNIASTNLDMLQKDVDNILTIFKLNKRVMMARNKDKKELSLRKIINRIIEEAKPLIQDKKLELKIDIPDEADKGLIDERDLNTLLHNIIDNAIKFTENGSISITSRIKGGRFEIKIKDTGCGIAPEDKDRVFSRIYKQCPAVENKGLPICQEIAEIHRGKINVASKGVGKGTTVTVALPQ